VVQDALTGAERRRVIAVEALGIDPMHILDTQFDVATSDLVVVTTEGQKALVHRDGGFTILMGPGFGEQVEELTEPEVAPEEVSSEPGAGELLPLEDEATPLVGVEVDLGESAEISGDGSGVSAEPITDRFKVFKGADDQFYFRRLAGNGEIVSQSEGYKLRRDAASEAEREAAGELAVEIV